MKLYVYLCPSCEREQLPPGCRRTQCAECGTYYSREDERPDENERSGWWWERNKNRYPRPAKIRQVVFADPSIAPIVEADDYADLEKAYRADAAVARAWCLHLVSRFGLDGGILIDEVERWLDEDEEIAA